MVIERSYVYLTSSAVSSRPLTGGLLCQRTPLRSLNTHVVSLGWVHDSARSPSTGSVPGVTPGPAFTRTSRLCVNDSATKHHQCGVAWGSKLGGSKPAMRNTPPRLGVWAWTGRAAVVVTASARTVTPAPRRRSRRGQGEEGGGTGCGRPPGRVGGGEADVERGGGGGGWAR